MLFKKLILKNGQDIIAKLKFCSHIHEYINIRRKFLRVRVFVSLRATYGTQNSEFYFFVFASYQVPVRLGGNFRYLC